MTASELIEILGNVGEFLGSIGVLATLVYLSIQIREAGKSSKFSAVQANRAERLEWFKSCRDSPYIAAIYQRLSAGEPLDETESYRLEMHLAGLWALIYSDWVQHQLGLAGELGTQQGITLNMALNRQTSMEWWDTYGRAIYPNEFIDFVERRRRSAQ